jgi:PBP1b-binding outer membrane lipoprotein LpoB
MTIKTSYSVSILVLFSVFVGCAPYPSSYMAASSYSQSEEGTLSESLFNSDNSVLTNNAVDQILNQEIDYLRDANIAVLKFPDNYSNPYNNYLSETYLKNTQAYLDTVSSVLSNTGLFDKVVLLPNLLTPSRPSIPLIREAAVRLQAEYILVYKINSNVYSRYRSFRANEYKAFSTIEMVLIHTRTGIIPYTHIETQEAFRKKTSNDLDDSEAVSKTIQLATVLSLEKAGDNLVEFLKVNF